MLKQINQHWGSLDWVLSKLPRSNWKLIGSISTEARCAEAVKQLSARKQLEDGLFYLIRDPESHSTPTINIKIEENKSVVQKLSKKIHVESHELLEEPHLFIKSLNEFLGAGTGNLIIDISTLPKRFFFPLIKIILTKKNLTNFLVCYTSPQRYCDNDLSSNPRDWEHLPLFLPSAFPETKAEIAFVGVGFMPFSLPKLLESKYKAIPVNFVFPFPPGPPHYQRTWDFMRKIEQSYRLKDADKIIRVNSSNMPDAFDHIQIATENGKIPSIFAPYGPKPLSLAMCLHAIKYDRAVYYTQPEYYNPDYSYGIGAANLYCIKLNGTTLF